MPIFSNGMSSASAAIWHTAERQPVRSIEPVTMRAAPSSAK
jgi:hypothetical protein